MTAYSKKTWLQSMFIFAALILIMLAPLSWADSSSTIQTQINPAQKVPPPVTSSKTVNSAIKKIAQCDPDKIECSNTCIDPKTDNKNCGACGKKCASTETCLKGVCICVSPHTMCGGKCVSLSGDTANCGGCGHVCGMKSKCYQGRCTNDK
jgi:hypothetical protein